MAQKNLKCTGCGKEFGGITLFNAHRAGSYEDEHPGYGRHCLTDDEMRVRGYVERNGKWIEPMPPEVLAKLAKKRGVA